MKYITILLILLFTACEKNTTESTGRKRLNSKDTLKVLSVDTLIKKLSKSDKVIKPVQKIAPVVKVKIFFTSLDLASLDQDYKNYLEQFLEIPYDDSNKIYRRRWTKDINTYASNYNTFDISVAPLVFSEYSLIL